MPTNQYHLLSFIPAVEAWEMPASLEALARQLVASGRLRINADTERNFVTHGTADSDESFSRRELTDPALMPATIQRLKRHVAPAAGPDGVEQLLALLHKELKKTRSVSVEKELRVARVLVQSAHPSVIQLLLATRTEIFVSYAHNLGDLMPVHRWQTDALNSGLQATSDSGTAVYISCGGDPFFEGEQKTYTTDGFPALARMVIIAGQELGHFSDLLRRNGQIVGRYSTDQSHTQLRANPRVAEARLADTLRVNELKKSYQHAGLDRLHRAETAVLFYNKRWKYSPPWMWHQLRRGVLFCVFIMRCRGTPLLRGGTEVPLQSPLPQRGRGLGEGASTQGTARGNAPSPNLSPVGGEGYADSRSLKLTLHPRHMRAHALAMFLGDMAFNLAPDADVYRRADPLEEEAVACIEALARVPQQVHKWGAAAVAAAWPNLYAIYYGTVIPGCIAAAGGEVTPNIHDLQIFIIWLRRILRPRPSYYPMG